MAAAAAATHKRKNPSEDGDDASAAADSKTAGGEESAVKKLRTDSATPTGAATASAGSGGSGGESGEPKLVFPAAGTPSNALVHVQETKQQLIEYKVCGRAPSLRLS